MSQPNQPSATVELLRQLHQLYTNASATEQQTAMELAQLLMMQASSTPAPANEELPSDG